MIIIDGMERKKRKRKRKEGNPASPPPHLLENS